MSVTSYGSAWHMPMGALTPNMGGGYSESRDKDNRGGEDVYK